MTSATEQFEYFARRSVAKIMQGHSAWGARWNGFAWQAFPKLYFSFVPRSINRLNSCSLACDSPNIVHTPSHNDHAIVSCLTVQRHRRPSITVITAPRLHRWAFAESMAARQCKRANIEKTVMHLSHKGLFRSIKLRCHEISGRQFAPSPPHEIAISQGQIAVAFSGDLENPSTMPDCSEVRRSRLDGTLPS